MFSANTITISPHDRRIVFTDIAIEFPKNTYGRIACRSGLALHHFIDVGGGVVDADYRGNVGVVFINHGGNDFIITQGDRILLVIEKICQPTVVEVIDLTDTERRARGLGSTGVNNKGC